MPAVILDACGALNLYASGRFLEILTGLPWEWYLPAAVQRETQSYRQPDPADPEKLIAVAIDFGPAFANNLLHPCDCENDDETILYVDLAARIGDDGESMGIAVAKCRGWFVMTDDKKARRIATELGVDVVSTPEVMRKWATATRLKARELSQLLQAIERFANYRPARGAIEYAWWMKSLTSK